MSRRHCVWRKKLAALETFLEELDALFADRQAARAWLAQPLTPLKGATPREMIVAGHVDCVTGVLYAINAGATL